RLEDIRGVRADSYSVYFALAPDEVSAVSNATATVVANTEWTIIPLGNNRAATTDELAIAVHATDRRVALETAVALWNEVARRAHLSGEPQITQIIDPNPR